MLRAESTQNDKIISALEGLQLGVGELETAEKYLNGEAGEEVLTGMAFRDMTQKSSDALRAFEPLFESFYKKKRYEEAGKLFNLLYAIGGSTCSQCFRSIYGFQNMAHSGVMKIDRAKALAVYTHAISNNSYSFGAHALMQVMAPLAESDPGVVLRAYREYKGNASNGKILLITLYFCLRYGQEDLETGKSGAFLLKEGDRGLLEEYEDLVVEPLGMVFAPDASKDSAVRKLVEQIRRGKPDREQLSALRNRKVNETVFTLLGGCAFANYRLSEKLCGAVIFCSAAAPGLMLKVMESMDVRGEMNRLGGELQELFGISSLEVISWAARRIQGGLTHRTVVDISVVKEILRGQFERHPREFIEGYNKADYQAAHVMAEIIQEKDPDLYRREVLLNGRDAQRDKVMRLLLSSNRSKAPEACRDYLEGKSELEALYAIRDQLASPYYGSYWECRGALDQYVNTYHDEVFYSRCMALAALWGTSYFFTWFSASTSEKEAFQRELEHIFQGLTMAGVRLEDQLGVVNLMVENTYEENKKQAILRGSIAVFRQYLAERTQETVDAFAGAGADGRHFALLVYGGEGDLRVTEENREACGPALAEFAKGRDAWKEQILSYTQDSSKLVKQELEQMLAARPGWREQVTGLLSSRKAAERELGIRVLARWNTPQDQEALQTLYETEKNAKVRALLDTALGHAPVAEGGTEAGGPALTLQDLVREQHKGGKKRGLAWAYETPFSPVHTKSGEQASEEYLQALLLCYSSMAKPGINRDAALLAEDLEPRELAVYMGELFDKWMEAGAEAKKRWVLFAASIHGGSDIIPRLHHQIQEWPQMARGAIASDAVQALALSPQPQALLIVDGIARKFKFKQVRAAAGQALEFAAGQLGLTREQLEDKIVPSLGFDEHMERHFDYGNRSFTVTITTALEVEVFDENGKKLKNMPAPGARDDAEKAAAAYGAFKEMKKQMKATVSSQKQRLEMALSTERLWTVEAWRELFVQNPIMHQFAIGLVWGLYENHSLVQSFRYMEDGSFNTEDEEEYELPEQGQIGLVHPIELTKESLETWKQQLEDYEITQPVEQLNRTVYYLTQEEQTGRNLERFGGMLINDLSLGGKLTALGWYRGSVQDAGGFYTYYREDASLGLGAELHFSGSFVGSGGMGGEEVTVYDVRFYKAGTIERGSYCYDEVEGEKQMSLKDIPQRYFSEIVWQLTKATASSKERDEDWKAGRR